MTCMHGQMSRGREKAEAGGIPVMVLVLFSCKKHLNKNRLGEAMAISRIL